MAQRKRTTKKTTKKPQQRRSKGMTQAEKTFWTAISLGLATILFSIFCYFPPAITGLLGKVIHTNILLGLFSSTMYLIPVILLGLTIYLFKVKDIGRMLKKAGFSFLVLILLASLFQLFITTKDSPIVIANLHSQGTNLTGGGFVGGILAFAIYNLIGKYASIILVVFLMLLFTSILFKISFISILKSIIEGLKSEIDDINDVDVSKKIKDARKKAASNKKQKKDDDNSDVNSFIDSDNSSKKADDTSISEEELQKRIDKLIYENTDLPKETPEPEKPVDTTEANTPEHVQETFENDLTEPIGGDKSENPERVSATTPEEKAEISKEIESAIEVPQKEYEFPPMNLLNKARTPSADKRKEMSETARKLMDILKNFGVDAKLQQVTQGPTVTRYEIQPNTGIKLSKITGLAEDIALNLAVPTVLVAPVPGKAAVGIEVPNTSVNTVSVRELLESDEYKKGKSKLTVAFGKDIGGNVIVGDIAKMPHVLIAGSTGSGKSVCINTIIVSLLYKAKPDEVKLIMVDPKVVELSVYNGIPHLLIPVVTDPKRAAGALNWAVGEMMKRYSLFAQTATRNLEGYNNYIEKNGGEKLPQIVIIIDELADLMMVAAKEVEEYICRLAQLARAAGIHLMIATQRPSDDVITGLIKANVPSRIAFAVSSQVDSRTILDKGGAEKLLGRGDMLYHPAGLSSAKRVQGAFVSDDEIASITNFVKENNETSHYSEDLAEHIDNCAHGDYGVTDEDAKDDADELLPSAIELALELGQISTAMVQRRLKVGYARAGRIIDQLEGRGLISGANGSKPREVYRNRIMSDMALGSDEEE